MHKRAIFIPARLESTRLPRKLLLPTPGGMPLIVKTAENARKAAELCNADLYVCTDSIEIKIALACIDRPTTLFTPKDIDSGTKRVWYAYNELLRKSPLADSYKQIAIIQGDCPNIDPRAIERLFQKTHTVATLCTDRPNCTQEYYESSGIVNVVTDGSNANFLANDGGCQLVTRAIYFTRQYIPYAYRHVGVYLFNHQILRGCKVPQMLERSYLNRCENLEQMAWLENNFDFGCSYIPPDWAGDAIDTQADYERYCSNLKLQA